MRIGMIVYASYPEDPRVRREAEALIENGYSVDILCLSNDGETKTTKINQVNVYRILQNLKGKGKIFSISTLVLFIVFSFVKISILNFKNRYDILHIHNIPNILIFTGIIPKIFGTKIILDMHEIMPELFVRKLGFNKDHFFTRVVKLFEKLSVIFSDFVITASPFFTKKVAQRNGKNRKYATILNLPDPKYFIDCRDKVIRQDNIFKLVYPGTLSEIHGIDIAINAIKLIVNETDIPIQFHIFGNGGKIYCDSIIEQTNSNSLNDFIFFHKEVLPEQLIGIFKTMDAGIVPKRNGIFADDAMSTKLFEFAAVGLPTIVSRTKSDAYYFDDSMVLFFEPENERDLANCIIKIYHDDLLKKKLSKNSLKLFKKVNWTTEKKKLWSIYDKIWKP